MDCAGFEQKLTGLISGEWSEGERASGIGDLCRHAEACPACRGTADLIRLLALPPDERDVVAHPADPYWEELRIAVGLRAKGADARDRKADRRVWAVAAAAALIVALGLWAIRGPAPEEGTAGRGASTIVAASIDREVLPQGLDRLLQRAEPDAAIEGLDFLSGLSSVAGSGPGPVGEETGWSDGFLPDLERIDAESRGALLDWLREANRSENGAES